MNRNWSGAIAPALEPFVPFTPRDPLCFLSNDALVGHIWVNHLNAPTSVNEYINKALLFVPAPKWRKEPLNPLQIEVCLNVGKCCTVTLQF